jgi:hypothetical protein
VTAAERYLHIRIGDVQDADVGSDVIAHGRLRERVHEFATSWGDERRGRRCLAARRDAHRTADGLDDAGRPLPGRYRPVIRVTIMRKHRIGDGKVRSAA